MAWRASFLDRPKEEAGLEQGREPSFGARERNLVGKSASQAARALERLEPKNDTLGSPGFVERNSGKHLPERTQPPGGLRLHRKETGHEV